MIVVNSYTIVLPMQFSYKVSYKVVHTWGCYSWLHARLQTSKSLGIR